MFERLKILQDTYNGLPKEGRDRYIKSFDTDLELQNEVKVLAKHYLNRTIKGCSWCALGAFLELLKLNSQKMEQKDNNNILGFKLLAGTLLHDPINKEFSKILTPQSLTDELALYHLALNPRARDYFSQLPENIDELLNKYIQEQSEGALKGADDVKGRQLDAMRSRLTIMKKAFENVETLQAERKLEIEALETKIVESEQVNESAGVLKLKAISEGIENIEVEIRAAIISCLSEEMSDNQIVDSLNEYVTSKKVTKTRLRKLIHEVRAEKTEE